MMKLRLPRFRLPDLKLPRIPIPAFVRRIPVRRIAAIAVRVGRRLSGKLLPRWKRPEKPVRPRELVPRLVGVLAGAIGLLGALHAIRSSSAWGVPVGLAMHGAAVFLCLVAARMRRRGDISDAETDIVLTAAAFVPGLGPGIAWTLPRISSQEAVENAHQVIEAYRSHVKPLVPDWERSLFTGDRDRDLARKLDAESFREVLRHGDTDQKRSALFRLAELGAPHHIELIRDCLVDDDGEVRLYAYGELDRLTRVHEEEIGKSRRLVEADENDVEARLRLSRAHFELAASGVLDPRTASFHFRAAANEAQTAAMQVPGEIAPVLAEARAHAHLGDLDAAERCVGTIAEENLQAPEVCLVRAEVAFKRRDFDAARLEAGVLLLTETPLPGWLQAICMTPEGKVLGQFEDVLKEIREEAS
jgi:hypothetical protein